MRPVHLQHVEPGVRRASRGGRECVDHAVDPGEVEGDRLVEAVEGDGRGSGCRPPAIDGRHRSAFGCPGPPRRCFAAGMGELDAGVGSAVMDRLDDRGEGVALLVIPEPQVTR